MIPDRLQAEIEELKSSGHAVEIIEAEGWANAIFSNHQLPSGYNKSTTTLLVKFPMSYPNGRPDMFWVDQDLTLKAGGIPQSAEAIENALGKTWRRYSWHPTKWNPGQDNASTYLEFVNNRLALLK